MSFVSGTTWMQEIMYLVYTEGDIDGSNKTPVFERFNFIEADADLEVVEPKSGFKRLQKEAPPRLIKTHLGSQFFKKTLDNSKTKFVVVFRNPKDMLVSYYNFYKMVCYDFDPNGKWEEFFERFRNDKLVHGSIFEMQLSWWKYRDNPRVKIFKFEDMLKDPELTVRQVAAFLEKDITEDLIQKIVERTSFKFMKNHPMLNYSSTPSAFMNQNVSPFMRKGQVGDWKNYFSEEQRNYVDEMSRNRFETQGLFFED